jgi:hypothetical protein
MPTKRGDMTTGAQEGFAIMLEELEKNNATVNEVKESVTKQGERLTAVENGLGEVLKVVNAINDKITTDNIEQKAAVASAFQAFFATKGGKILFFILLISVGLAMAYIVDHATGVSQIVSSVK